MQPDRSFALLVTWTTYGTWLPGAPRGYVSETQETPRDWAPKVNTPGEPYTADRADTLRSAQQRQKHATIWLTVAQAACVARTLIEACQTRMWRILRAAVMANHVHAVVADCPDDGPAVRRILKGVTQAALSREQGHPRRWWTQGGSNRYLHGSDSIEAAIRYVADQQRILAEIVNGKLGSRD